MHHVDPYFGPDPAGDLKLMAKESSDPDSWRWTAADRLFLQLVAAAKQRGIRIVIDDVFNHTGRDFFAFAHLREHQDESPYDDWYIVQHYDDPGSCWAAYCKVILPLASPGLVITALFSFMSDWSEYIVAAQILQDREMFALPLGLKSFQSSLSTQWGLYAAESLLVSLPVVVVFILLSRYLVSSLTIGSIKE